jgi:uncharacterized RDD family membrane protein YckC
LECRRCGAQIADESAFCSACGQSTREETTAPSDSTPPPAVRKAPLIAYAGFWLRAVAYVVDTCLLGFVAGIVILGPLMQRAGLSPENPWVFFTSVSRQVVAINLLMVMVSWVYWAMFESSAWQATPGKKILGLYVTDLQGKRITFARASGRYFGKIISSLLLMVGYLMAGFTPRKQALHDMIAECLVLKKTSTAS